MSQVTIHRPRFVPPPLKELRRLELPRRVPVPTRSRRIAAVLALLLGWMGGHKLYLLRPEQALLSIAFCWTFVPFLVGIAEGVTFLMMSDEEFAQSYETTRSYTCRLVRAMFRKPTRPARGYEFKPYTPW